jgi:hypothetical protein
LLLQLDQHCLSTTEPLPTPACSATAESAAASTTEATKPATESTAVITEAASVQSSCTKRSEHATAISLSAYRKRDEQQDKSEEQSDAEWRLLCC